MSFQQLPAPTADGDAPLPFGPSYVVTEDLHEGCARGGRLVAGIDRALGASVETCTGCRYRRVITGARPRAFAPVALSLEQLLAHPEKAARQNRPCACGCGQLLPPHCHRYASVACQQSAKEQRRAAAQSGVVQRCACGCGRPLAGRQTLFASADCQRTALIRAALARQAAGSSSPQRVNPEPVCVVEGCGPFPYAGNGRPPKRCPSHETSSTSGKRRRRELARQRLTQEQA